MSAVQHVAIALVGVLAAAVLIVAMWQRVWEPNHAVLIRELGQRLDREQRRRSARPRVAQRVRVLAWVAELRDLERQLVIAGRDADVARWLATQVARMGMLATALLLLNLLWLAVNGSLAIDWVWVGVGTIVLPPLAGYLELRSAVRRTRDELGRACRDMLELLAVLASGTRAGDPMRDPAEIRPGDWIAAYARWRRDPSLRSVVEGNRWRLLTPRRPTSAAGWFELLADEYGVPEARAVARIVRLQRERGPEVADEYLREARRLSKQVLVERQVRARRDRLAHTVASVGLLAAFFAILVVAASSVRL